jgi:2-iminobutanoate/2-iminopropanoate deaminase
MKKINIFCLMAIMVGIAIAGCQPSENRIREIIKEELSSAMKRSVITDANVIGPYSPAQKVGNFLFISGQIAIDQETSKLINDNIEVETRQALDNLTNILHKAGYDSSDVVSTTIYLKDINDYAKVNNIYGGYFQEGNYPARATVQVAALPREARIEVSAIFV